MEDHANMGLDFVQNVFDSPLSIKCVPKVFSSYSSMVVKHWEKVEK
jgi:hypothetical protein